LVSVSITERGKLRGLRGGRGLTGAVGLTGLAPGSVRDKEKYKSVKQEIALNDIETQIKTQ